jgi:DNA-binding transcriptional regulator YdaS (Cro superfamily)
MSDETPLPPALARAAKEVGGVTKLASLLGIKRPAIYQWKRVPAERAVKIEEVTGGKVTRQELRPDLYEDAA